MMINPSREINENGVKLILPLVLNGKRTNHWENAANECLTDTVTDGYNKFKQIIIRIQELEMKGNEKSLEEENLFKRLKVEDENTIVLLMKHNASAEQGEEEDPAGDVDVEDDTSEGYKDEEDAE